LDGLTAVEDCSGFCNSYTFSYFRLTHEQRRKEAGQGGEKSVKEEEKVQKRDFPTYC
jgi:hypothetical protein